MARLVKTSKRSSHQSNFGSGVIRPEFYGNSLSEQFQKGVRALENWDIRPQNILRKRGGLVGDRRFGPTQDNIIFREFATVFKRDQQGNPLGITGGVVSRRDLNVVQFRKVVLFIEAFHLQFGEGLVGFPPPQEVLEKATNYQQGYALAATAWDPEKLDRVGPGSIWVHTQTRMRTAAQKIRTDEGVRATLDTFDYALEGDNPLSTEGSKIVRVSEDRYMIFFKGKNGDYILPLTVDLKEIVTTSALSDGELVKPLYLGVGPSGGYSQTIFERGYRREFLRDGAVKSPGLGRNALNHVDFTDSGLYLGVGLGPVVPGNAGYRDMTSASGSNFTAAEVTRVNNNGGFVLLTAFWHPFVDSNYWWTSYVPGGNRQYPFISAFGVYKSNGYTGSSSNAKYPATLRRRFQDLSLSNSFMESAWEGEGRERGAGVYFPPLVPSATESWISGTILHAEVVYVFARVKEGFLEKARAFDGHGGECFVVLDELDVTFDSGGNRNKPTVSNALKPFYVRVWKFNGDIRGFDIEDTDESFPNAVLAFFTTKGLRDTKVWGKEEPNYGVQGDLQVPSADSSTTIRNDATHATSFGFKSIVTMDVTLQAPLRMSDFFFPNVSKFEGAPSTAISVDRRTILAGFKTNKVVVGADGIPFGFQGDLPSQMEFAANITTKIHQGEGLSKEDQLAIRPDSRASADYVYWYRVQVSEGRDAAAVFELSLGPNENIEWIGLIRGMVVGTTRKEILVGTAQNAPLGPANASFRNVFSARGSKSPLVAQGDYSLFFVGPTGDTLYYMEWDEGVAGLRSVNANAIGDNIGQITDMSWDRSLDALFVIHDGKLSLYYLNREFDVKGWGHYTLPPGIVPLNLVEFGESVGISTTDGRVFRFDQTTHKDRGDTDIRSLVSFWRIPTGSNHGPASPWKTRAQYTHLTAMDVTEIKLGPREDRIGRDPDQPLGITEFDLNPYIEQDSLLPYVDVVHTKDEEAKILSIDGAYEIQEA